MTKQTLFHKAKNGETRVWSVWSENDTVYTEYGMLGGAMQVSSKRCEVKNEGRSNATTPQEQAELEAQSMYTNRIERKYSATIEESQEQLLLPMLAHKYEPKKHKAESWYAQPKFDGTRALAYWEGNEVRLISRQGKDYTIPHVKEHLETFLPKDSIFDGELYIHGRPLQQVVSLVKKFKVPESLDVTYCVYDAPQVQGDDTLPFSTRCLHYSCLIGDACEGPVKLVDTTPELEDNIDAINAYQQKCIENGYEGAILRRPSGIYQWGYRSHDLLKVKTFQDAEFEVIGYRDGRGKMEGKVIFECQNDQNDKTFEVVPKASMEERAEMFNNATSYLGRMYTVQFFDRSDDLIPRFPVGIAFLEDR